jgi:hypothetical protein
MDRFFVSHRFFSLPIFPFISKQKKKGYPRIISLKPFLFSLHNYSRFFVSLGDKNKKLKFVWPFFASNYQLGSGWEKKTLKETTIFFLFRNWCRQFRISEIALQ